MASDIADMTDEEVLTEIKFFVQMAQTSTDDEPMLPEEWSLLRRLAREGIARGVWDGGD